MMDDDDDVDDPEFKIQESGRVVKSVVTPADNVEEDFEDVIKEEEQYTVVVENAPPPPPLPQQEILSAAGLSTVIELGKGTNGKCGTCTGCKRKPCQECSACERRDFGNCIDTYCLSDESGRAQRLAMKELYIRTLGGGAGANAAGRGPVSYTHLTLPTTPYV